MSEADAAYWVAATSLEVRQSHVDALKIVRRRAGRNQEPGQRDEQALDAFRMTNRAIVQALHIATLRSNDPVTSRR